MLGVMWPEGFKDLSKVASSFSQINNTKEFLSTPQLTTKIQ